MNDRYEFWRDDHRDGWHENDFTDDTDQLLLISQCVLSTSGYLIPEQFAFRLKEWTDVGFPELQSKGCCGVGFTVGSVIDHPEFLTNSYQAAFDIWHSGGCDLAANGAMMRTAVLGIPFFFDESQVVLNAIECAKVTHADPRCIFSSVVVSVLISRTLRLALRIGDEFQLDAKEREKFLQVMESKVISVSHSVCDGATSKRALYKSQLSMAELCIPKIEHADEVWPKYNKPDSSRQNTPVQCLDDPNRFSTASCGEDDALAELIKNVVSDYKFLLDSKDDIKKERWHFQAEKFCFSDRLRDLDLDEENSIGFTLKCLGSALFCFSRKNAVDLTNGDFFMQVITELVLEAGDADTNGAVAGALLGCRLGMKGLPNDWLTGLRNKEFLIKISEELVELVMNQLNSV